MSDVAGRVSSLRFVGREVELEQLVAAFKTAAADAQTTTVLIGGEAGVGKTRLVAEVADRVTAADGLVVAGACIELATSPLPFGPIVQVLRTMRRALDAATFDAVVEPAAAVVGRLLPELARDGADHAE